MIELRPDHDTSKDISPNTASLTFPPSFYNVYEKLQKWSYRFSHTNDQSIYSDLFLFYLIATKKYLDHRTSSHLFRLILSIHHMQKKLLHSATFHPHSRHLEIRWLPTSLVFPFSSKPVLGCLIGFNVMDRYELFDEENVLLALQKYLPELRLVKESSYWHTSQHKNLKIFYFEIEKKNGSFFSLREQNLLKDNLEEKVKNTIQTLSPTIFMALNEEDIYKNILVLSQEIHSLQDLPQAHITLDQQTGKEIIFRVTLVFISPFHRFSLKQCFVDCQFVPQRTLTVRHLENHPIEAHIFRLHLTRDASLLRSDGSVDFYSARQKVADLIKAAIGEFRDYNGGIIIKQQELLHSFKQSFPEIAERDPELMESFFYALTPIEKQVVLLQETLSTLFKHYLAKRKEKLPSAPTYTFNKYEDDNQVYLVVHGNNSSMIDAISNLIQDQSYNSGIAYNIIENAEGVFFNCVFQETDTKSAEPFIQILQDSLNQWQKKMKSRQTLRVAFEYSIVSLDPRIGGEVHSGDILRLLFEGLTRYDQNGHIENGVAESIEISPNSRQYVFKLRRTFWNDGSPVSAYDFEYAWKKILSPDFKTAFAYFFYPIKNAKEAKEGKVSADEIGIHVIDDFTIKIDLVRPTPYFLQLTANPLYSPVNRHVDQQHPQWPYQCEKNYPCNGPFQLKINHPNQGYQFIKNPYYWDANQIVLDEITMTSMSPGQASQSMQKKEVDWVGNPFGGWNPFYQPNKEDKIVSFPNSSVCWCVFNTQYPPFHNKKFRQAIAYSLERSQIISEVGSFMPLNPAYSVLLPYQHETSRTLFPECNKQIARQLLHEALQELELNLEELPTLTLIYGERVITREFTARSLKQQIKDCLGINCELKPLPWNMLFSKMTRGNYQMGIITWSSRIDDPIYTLNDLRFSKEETNFAKWEHPEYQRLLDLSEQEVNPFQRSSYLFKAEEIIGNEMPIIPLFYEPSQALIKRNLSVCYKPPSGPYNISRIRKEI